MSSKNKGVREILSFQLGLKYLIIFLLTIIGEQMTCAQNLNPGICLNPEINAEFKYGAEELNSFIANNLIVPYKARYYGINGDVELLYIVDTLGNIGEITVKIENIDLGPALYAREGFGNESFSGFFSNEAIRVIRLLSGLYKPALHQGMKVSSWLSITLSFKTKQYDENERQVRVDKASKVKRIEWNFGIYTQEEPDYALIRYDLGVLKMEENKLEIACKYFEEALRMKSDYVDALFNLGIAYARLQQTEKACQMWLKARDLGDQEAGRILDDYCQ
ncbi:MAG TPA: hypothetical protein PLR01_14270 [Bacteroidales bacterium]|jgi:tetratricopeptide (TPR) repeat protein|nr:hypothetical protein [Bacteroidales bacterium]HPI87535.1 hypothetical protein [Bacteroidales bacterium]